MFQIVSDIVRIRCVDLHVVEAKFSTMLLQQHKTHDDVIFFGKDITGHKIFVWRIFVFMILFIYYYLLLVLIYFDLHFMYLP